MENRSPNSWDDPLKCHVGDWVPAGSSAVKGWDKSKGVYWYLVGGFIRRRMQGAGPVNPATPWGFEFRRVPTTGKPAWVRCC